MSEKKWEEVTVDPKGAGHTYRLRVRGGYLYRTVTYRYPEKHAQWDRALRANGNSVLSVLKALSNSPRAAGYDAKWRAQAQEIATQTSVFVRAKRKDKKEAKSNVVPFPKGELLTVDYVSPLMAARRAIADSAEYGPGNVIDFTPSYDRGFRQSSR